MLQGINLRDLIVTGERRGPSVALALLVGVALPGILAAPALAQRVSFVPETVVVSRIHSDPDTKPARNGESFPFIFNDPNVSGIQGSIFLDSFRIDPCAPRLGSLAVTGVTNGAITTSFSSKSEGALNLSVNGRLLTYMGYMGPPGAEGVSNSETTGATLTTNTAATYDRAVATIAANGAVTVTRETNAFSGDNPRGVIPLTAPNSIWRATPIRVSTATAPVPARRSAFASAIPCRRRRPNWGPMWPPIAPTSRKSSTSRTITGGGSESSTEIFLSRRASAAKADPVFF